MLLPLPSPGTKQAESPLRNNQEKIIHTQPNTYLYLYLCLCLCLYHLYLYLHLYLYHLHLHRYLYVSVSIPFSWVSANKTSHHSSNGKSSGGHVLRTPVWNARAAANAKGDKTEGTAAAVLMFISKRRKTGEAMKGQLAADSRDVLSSHPKGRMDSRNKGSRSSDLSSWEKSQSGGEWRRWIETSRLCQRNTLCAW